MAGASNASEEGAQVAAPTTTAKRKEAVGIVGTSNNQDFVQAGEVHTRFLNDSPPMVFQDWIQCRFPLRENLG